MTFAKYTITTSIGAKTRSLLQRNVEYYLEVSDVVGTGNAGLNTGQLQVSINCGGCGYFKIGAALRALESEAEGLGAAFYWILIRSLYRVMRIYDHSDAQVYEEILIESSEADDEPSRHQHEFPEVDKALPECIRKSLQGEPGLWRLQYRRLLERHSQGKYAAWIGHLKGIPEACAHPKLHSGSFRVRVLRWTAASFFSRRVRRSGRRLRLFR